MLIYLACPYGTGNTGLQWERHSIASRTCAKLLCALPNDSVICPIIQGHAVKWWVDDECATEIEIEDIKVPPADFWYKRDMQILAQCSALYVLCIDGWRESTGVKMEIDYAKKNNMPILYINEYLEELDNE